MDGCFGSCVFGHPLVDSHTKSRPDIDYAPAKQWRNQTNINLNLNPNRDLNPNINLNLLNRCDGAQVWRKLRAIGVDMARQLRTPHVDSGPASALQPLGLTTKVLSDSLPK